MFGGAEVWMLTTMQALRDRGHQTILMCRPQIRFYEKAKDLGLTVLPVHFRGDFDPINIFKIYKTLKKAKVHLVITNQDKELRLAGIASRLVPGVKVIHRRAIDHPLKNNWRYRMTYTRLADHIITNSEATKISLMQNSPWLPSEKISIVYNGLDLKQFDDSRMNGFKREFKLPQGAKIIGFVGQLDERKGIEILLEAFAAIARKIPEACLLLVGEGKLQSKIEAWCRASNLTTKVILTGFREDIPAVMKNIHVLVLPSYWEGFGWVLIEAMAAGKPVVTTRISSMSEIVQDGRQGFLVPTGDRQSLSRAIMQILNDEGLRQRMGRAGRQRVEQFFTLNRMISQFERLCYQLCGCRS